jgi:hypothetical protein
MHDDWPVRLEWRGPPSSARGESGGFVGRETSLEF